MSNSSPDVLLTMYRAMYVARTSEERLLDLYKQGRVKGTMTSGDGNEGAIVGLCAALNPATDVCNLMQRDFAGYLMWDTPLSHLFAHYLGSADSPTGAKDGNVHHGIPDRGLLPMVSHLGAMLPNVVGATFARRRTQPEAVGMAIIGDGGTSTGDTHEALNIASVLGVPVLFVVENNQWAYSTPNSRQFACSRLSDRAIGYGIDGSTIDGMDAVVVHDTVAPIIDSMRSNPRPYLLETRTYRFSGHAAYDTAEYMDRKELAAWKKRDPLPIMRERILQDGQTDEESISALEEEWRQEVDREANLALAVGPPDPQSTSWAVYHHERPPEIPTYHAEDVTAVQAITAAMDHAMRYDDGIIVIGEDIGAYGGPFKTTKGLFDTYGRDRVIDMPLAESGFTGFAVGCAEMGLRPIVEMQFSDFSTDAVTQICMSAGTYYYRMGKPVPLTIRMPTGGGLSYGPFHSQELENLYAGFPGLKIVYPSDIEDFFTLLLASIFDPNPVLFFESKYLYRRVRGDVRFSGRVPGLDSARVVRHGTELTVVAYGAMLHETVAAVDMLGDEHSIEVIDPRILKPLDFETISRSVAKTHRILVVHESWPSASVAGDIIAAVAENNFFDLDAPPLQCCPPDTPVPFAPELEAHYRPGASAIRDRIMELLEY